MYCIALLCSTCVRVPGLSDLQFYHLMRRLTNLSRKQIYMVFDMLDTDGSGTLDFDEFYLLLCILVAQKVCRKIHPPVAGVATPGTLEPSFLFQLTGVHNYSPFYSIPTGFGIHEV